jgi:hypothetical protein
LKRKIPVKIIIIDNMNRSSQCDGYIHLAGTLHAHYTHLDIINCKILMPLREILRIKGLRLPCKSINGCVLISIPELNIWFKICVRKYNIKCLNHKVYTMLTRNNNIYITVNLG